MKTPTVVPFPVGVPEARRTETPPAVPERPRELQGGDGDDDDGPRPPRPLPNRLCRTILDYLLMRETHWRTAWGFSIPPWITQTPTPGAENAIERAVPEVVRALMQAPKADDRFVALAETVKAEAEKDDLPPMTQADHQAIASFTSAINGTHPYPIHVLQSAIEHAMRRLLTQAGAAELVALLTRQVAMSTGRKTVEQATTDASSARLQILAEQFPHLSPDEQQAIAALVAALANGTPSRERHVNAAVQRFLKRVLRLKQWALCARWSIDPITRQHEQEQSRWISVVSQYAEEKHGPGGADMVVSANILRKSQEQAQAQGLTLRQFRDKTLLGLANDPGAVQMVSEALQPAIDAEEAQQRKGSRR